MRRSIIVVAVLVAVVAPTASFAGGITEGAELEHARANARAGGPVSERDTELLERYGCSSGTRSAACGDRYDRPRRYYRSKRHRY
jgi:hypothetical protein